MLNTPPSIVSHLQLASKYAEKARGAKASPNTAPITTDARLLRDESVISQNSMNAAVGPGASRPMINRPAAKV